MVHEQQFEHLVQFFKVLGEPNRLKIVGLLAQKPHTVEQIATHLGVGVSTVSHHLSRLADAGFVRAKAESYYSVYSLRTEVLTSMAKTLLKQAERPRADSGENIDAFDRKVLSTFTTPDGRIKAFPVQEKKFLVLLVLVLKSFEPGVR